MQVRLEDLLKVFTPQTKFNIFLTGRMGKAINNEPTTQKDIQEKAPELYDAVIHSAEARNTDMINVMMIDSWHKELLDGAIKKLNN